MKLGFHAPVFGSLTISIALPALTCWLCPNEQALGIVGTVLQGLAVLTGFPTLHFLDVHFNGKGFWKRMYPRKVRRLEAKDLHAGRPTRGTRQFEATLENAEPPTLENRVQKLETEIVEAREEIGRARTTAKQEVRKVRTELKHQGDRTNASIDELKKTQMEVSGVATDSHVGWGFALLILAASGTLVSILANLS